MERSRRVERWKLRILGAGKPDDAPVSEWELHIMLAEKHNWTPAQVNELPLDYVEDYFVYQDAVDKARVIQEKRQAARNAAASNKGR